MARAMREMTLLFEKEKGRRPRTVKELSEFVGSLESAVWSGTRHLKSLEWIGR